MSYELELPSPSVGAPDQARDRLNTSAGAARRRGAIPLLALAAMVACGAAPFGVRAEPVPHPSGFGFVDSQQSVFYHGQRYCWYDSAWRGPGWYECGYAWRHGLGWGGGYGWHGWPGHHPWHWHHHHHPGHPRPGHPHPGGANPGPGRPPMGGPGTSPGGPPHAGGGGRPR